MLKQLNESEVQELEDRLEFFLLYPQESDQDVRNENYRSLRPVVGLDPKLMAISGGSTSTTATAMTSLSTT
jgi:hypothetical protein